MSQKNPQSSLATVHIRDYGDAYQIYRDAGWIPLPLKRGTKWPPPEGYTGEDRQEPDDRKYRRWSKQYAGGNLALAVPDGVVGIDIDAYEYTKIGNPKPQRKHGDKTYHEYARRYDKLPDTAWSSSRDDGVSGIYFFLLPLGVKLAGNLKGGDVEVVQRHHRYAVAWPSIHPETSDQYTWRCDDPEIEFSQGVPVVGTLPWLPDAWVEALTAGSQDAGTGFTGSISDWLDGLPEGRLPLGDRQWYRSVARRLQGSGSRYDTMLKAVGHLVHLGAEGKPGVYEALEELEADYVEAVSGDPGRQPYSEFKRALLGAVEKFGATADNDK